MLKNALIWRHGTYKIIYHQIDNFVGFLTLKIDETKARYLTNDQGRRAEEI